MAKIVPTAAEINGFDSVSLQYAKYFNSILYRV